MPETPDPFAHHPELRARITDPATSPFRGFTAAGLVAEEPHLCDRVYSNERRQAIRAEALAGHSGDLRIFDYGSLMWNLALRFVAHGVGDLGTSRDDLANIVDHLALPGITDAACSHLPRVGDDHLAAVDAERRTP